MSFSVKRLPRKRGFILISGGRAVNEESLSELHRASQSFLKAPYHFPVAWLRKTCPVRLNKLQGDNGEMGVISHLLGAWHHGPDLTESGLGLSVIHFGQFPVLNLTSYWSQVSTWHSGYAFVFSS